MKTVTVSKLKTSLRKYLRQVKAGREILITQHGLPVAKLSPAQSTLVHLVEMEKHGILKLGTGKLPRGFWDLPRPKDPKGLILKSVLKERQEGM